MLEDWRRSSVFDNVFTGNMYIGNVGEEKRGGGGGGGGVFSLAGVRLSSMSQYHNTVDG